MVGLLVSVVLLTSCVSWLVRSIFHNFGPAVHADLEWKVLRGAQELAKVLDLGLALGDEQLVEANFVDYIASEDIVAIVAEGDEGVVAQYGDSPWPTSALFEEPPGRIVETPFHLISWYPSKIEGSVVGRVALIVSKHRLIDAQQHLLHIEHGTIAVGAFTMLIGVLVVSFFSHLVIKRDRWLAEHTDHLEEVVTIRTAELDRRNRGMRLVFDHVNQGFITINLEGTMEPERSAIVDRWFEEVETKTQLQTLFHEAGSHTDAELLELGLEQLREQFMPELILEQLSSQISVNQQVIQTNYIPIYRGAQIHKLLVVLSDITEKLDKERAELDQKETLAVFQHIKKDRVGFIDFLKEARSIISHLEDRENAPVMQKRLVHTLKANAALYGLRSISALCHMVEDNLVHRGGSLTEEDLIELLAGWENAETLIAPLLGTEERSTMEIELDEYRRLRKRVASGANMAEMEAVLRALELEPVQKRLERLGEQARTIAESLGKAGVEIITQGNGVRLDSKTWTPFWSAAIHAVRNAVDHGLEDFNERNSLGKAGAGRIALSCVQHDCEIVVVVEDDGRGIAWEHIRTKAEKLGFVVENTQDLIEVLFADGVSSRTVANNISGRGFGMSALRDAVANLNGRINVESKPGHGTRFLFRFPGAQAVTMNSNLEIKADTAKDIMFDI